MNNLKTSAGLWTLWFAYWIYKGLKVKKDQNAESRRSRLFHLICLVITFDLIFAPSFPRPLSVQVLSFKGSAEFGLLLTLTGMIFAIWARNHLGEYWSGRVTLKEGHQLIKTGPYRIVRHPIYTGILTGLLGSAITRGLLSGFLGVALFTAAYFRKINIEENMLGERFDGEFQEYKKKTKALIPFLY